MVELVVAAFDEIDLIVVENVVVTIELIASGLKILEVYSIWYTDDGFMVNGEVDSVCSKECSNGFVVPRLMCAVPLLNDFKSDVFEVNGEVWIDAFEPVEKISFENSMLKYFLNQIYLEFARSTSSC